TKNTLLQIQNKINTENKTKKKIKKYIEKKLYTLDFSLKFFGTDKNREREMAMPRSIMVLTQTGKTKT
ncbi:hypothetical protein, partial [Klebsiella pneumoniae]|uniref:hypothetical protein n=1 Tax=Klebsiella pneumoniae TaxID=573 RepID=UPI0027315CA8